MRKYLLLLLLSGWVLQLSAQHPPVFEGMISDTTFIKINDLNVNLVRYSYLNKGINFLAVHDNEDTGVKAAFQYIKENGGRIIDTQYGGVRNFTFTSMMSTYQIDPNGIYTREGIEAGLAKFGNSHPDAFPSIELAAKVILNLYDLKKNGYLFTLHNNGDGGFGIASYLKGYELEKTGDSLHINFQMDPDDLIYVTEPKLFTCLKKADVNVVLQSQAALNDGSLSIYAMQQKIPYINVEVQHGHLEEHLRLIRIAVNALLETYPDLKEKTFPAAKME